MKCCSNICFHVSCVTITVFLCLCCQWPYGDICGIGPVGKGQGTEFNLTFRKGSGKKSETLKFSTEHRTELLTEALVRRNSFTALLPSLVMTDRQSSCSYFLKRSHKWCLMWCFHAF